MKILQIQCKFQARILPIPCCVQRNFPFFSSFFRYFQANLSKLLHFHFRKNIFGCFLNNFVRFFSMINNKFFQFEDFQLQIFQAFIFFNFVFTKIFFRLNFVKFKCEFSSDFWRIKIQNFKRNFFRQLHTTGKVLPKKRAFYNWGFKRNTSRSKNFSLFQTYKFLWKREIFLRLFSLNAQRITSTPLFWQYYVELNPR